MPVWSVPRLVRVVRSTAPEDGSLVKRAIQNPVDEGEEDCQD